MQGYRYLRNVQNREVSTGRGNENVTLTLSGV
jgi:hypothetical protein